MQYLIGFLSFGIVLGAIALYRDAVIKYVDNEQKQDLANRKVKTTYPDNQPSINDWFKYIHHN